VFAEKAWSGAAEGLLFGNARQVGIQALAIAVTLAYSMVVTFVIVKVIALAMRLRTNAREEGLGLDFTQHGEEAYSRGEGAILLSPDALSER
jgi:Amt family ammonium transporter